MKGTDPWNTGGRQSMRRAVGLSWWIAAAVAGLFCSVAAYGFDLQGHRGARGLAPENTIAAFAAALGVGVTTLELDVGLSRDGRVVIFHDRRLTAEKVRGPDGTFLEADGPPLVALDWPEIARHRVGGYKPASRSAERFPARAGDGPERFATLDDLAALLAQAGNGKVRLNIETKLSPRAPDETAPPAEFAAALLAALDRLGLADRTTIQSFDWRTLQAVQATAPAIPTVYLSAQAERFDTIRAGQDGPSPMTAGFDVDDYGGSVPRLVKAAGGAVWSPRAGDLTPALIAEAQALGLTVVPWTVNDRETMAKLVDWGVDGLITDYPDRLRAVLTERGIPVPDPTPVAP